MSLISKQKWGVLAFFTSQASPSCKHSCCPRAQLDWGFLRKAIYGYKQPKEMCLSIPYKLNLWLQGREEVCLSLGNNKKISWPPSPFLQGINAPWPTPFQMRIANLIIAYSSPHFSLFFSTNHGLVNQKLLLFGGMGRDEWLVSSVG